MGQEYFINSQSLEDKVRNLLPSQGGAGAGFDLSASTQIIPIVDLTESAEGSNLRSDLQTSFSFTSLTNTQIVNATNTVIVNNTGYFRVFGTSRAINTSLQELNLFDGTTSKPLIKFNIASIGAQVSTTLFDFIVFLDAGESLRGTSDASGDSNFIVVSTRQIADITGNLVNP